MNFFFRTLNECCIADSALLSWASLRRRPKKKEKSEKTPRPKSVHLVTPVQTTAESASELWPSLATIPAYSHPDVWQETYPDFSRERNGDLNRIIRTEI